MTIIGGNFRRLKAFGKPLYMYRVYIYHLYCKAFRSHNKYLAECV